MKALNSLNENELLAKIYESKKLTDKLSNFITTTENEYLSDICNCLEGCRYSIGFYNQNYITVTDSVLFLQSVGNIIDNFGASEKLEKIYNKAHKLFETNLFEYTIEQLSDEMLSYFKDMCDYVENVCYKIYCNEIHYDVMGYIESFTNCYLDGMFINSQNEIVRVEKM